MSLKKLLEERNSLQIKNYRNVSYSGYESNPNPSPLLEYSALHEDETSVLRESSWRFISVVKNKSVYVNFEPCTIIHMWLAISSVKWFRDLSPWNILLKGREINLNILWKVEVHRLKGRPRVLWTYSVNSNVNYKGISFQHEMKRGEDIWEILLDVTVPFSLTCPLLCSLLNRSDVSVITVYTI